MSASLDADLIDASGYRVLARPHHILHQLLGVGAGGDLLGDLSAAVHDNNAVGDRKREGYF